MSNVVMRVGGRALGTTDESGALSTTIPSGRVRMRLVRGEETLLELDLLTDAGEIIQMIATLREGQKPDLDIESSGRSPILAKERLKEGKPKVEEPGAVGSLVGTITSAEDDAPIASARVFFSGTENEAETGPEGRYQVELPAGNYAVSVVHPDFATQTQENVRVIPDREVTVNMELTPAGIELQDYVVTAPYVEGSVAATLERQRETASVMEVLGAEQMAVTGDSDAAEALQRVAGLTIEQDKFVLIRGQPFRYTYTLWNGSPLPSPEPLVRIVPLDLFPAGILAGIEVVKSYSADLPAEFGAGLINLKTRGIPEENFFNVTVSTGYNSVSTFSDGWTYDGGSLDFLGYDDGTRALPEPVREATEEADSLEELDDDLKARLGRTFSNNFALEERTLPPDVGLSLSGGSSTETFDDGRLGAIASLSFSNEWRDQDRIQRSFALGGDNELTIRNDLVENRTDMNADIGGLLTLEAAWEKHNVSANTFYAHQTQQRSQLTTGLLRRSDNGRIREFLLSWIERELIAQQLKGRHDFGFLLLEYRGMFARAGRDAPDRREYSYLDREPFDGTFVVFGNTGMNREYSGVTDNVWSGRVDLTFRLLDPEKSWLGLDAKVGGALRLQDRDAFTSIYKWRPNEQRGVDVTETDPEVLYDPAQTGTTILLEDLSGSTRDDYVGFLDIMAGYALLDVRLADLFRVAAGLRYEIANFQVTTFQFTPEDENAVVASFDQEDLCIGGSECALYPSASITWFLTEEMQIRSAYGRTTSRPNLNELSDARFFDPDTGEAFLGNPDLVPTVIDGYDVRWEWYPSATETLTLGGFYKSYTNPIERTFRQVGGTDALPTFQNAESARVLGLEVGGRLELGHLRDIFGGPKFIDNFYLMGNLALLNSRVRLATVGVDTDAERPLDGQAEYTLNLQGGYSSETHELNVALNYIGTRLHRAGIQGQPNVFLQPIPGLDITWSWHIWDDDNTRGTLRLNGSNLLNPTYEWLQGDQVWRSFRRGLEVNVAFALGFNEVPRGLEWGKD